MSKMTYTIAIGDAEIFERDNGEMIVRPRLERRGSGPDVKEKLIIGSNAISISENRLKMWAMNVGLYDVFFGMRRDPNGVSYIPCGANFYRGHGIVAELAERGSSPLQIEDAERFLAAKERGTDNADFSNLLEWFLHWMQWAGTRYEQPVIGFYDLRDVKPLSMDPNPGFVLDYRNIEDAGLKARSDTLRISFPQKIKTEKPDRPKIEVLKSRYDGAEPSYDSVYFRPLELKYDADEVLVERMRRTLQKMTDEMITTGETRK